MCNLSTDVLRSALIAWAKTEGKYVLLGTRSRMVSAYKYSGNKTSSIMSTVAKINMASTQFIALSNNQIPCSN